ncbi:DUF2892 domain-containing protein [Marivita sp. GX14005]|uniref:YgaP family membrane protein n=1 Tax=Marivita sp. GX14005 TaxID=2942276 RepID=UPI002019AA85|nr:DUF2892 domain-containing protein [Marivita sp. GX14005]MCL3882868.1 DUF2892 domain-containing protein [Marivita sp. GX14005]
MLKKNMGTTDRVLRVIVGLALLLAFFMGVGGDLNWLFLIGIIPVLTGLVGSCPAYTLFGINSCPRSR